MSFYFKPNGDPSLKRILSVTAIFGLVYAKTFLASTRKYLNSSSFLDYVRDN